MGLEVNLKEPGEFHVVIQYLFLTFSTSIPALDPRNKQCNLTKALSSQSWCSINKPVNTKYVTWGYMPWRKIKQGKWTRESGVCVDGVLLFYMRWSGETSVTIWHVSRDLNEVKECRGEIWGEHSQEGNNKVWGEKPAWCIPKEAVWLDEVSTEGREEVIRGVLRSISWRIL